jgi:hypothetical protein
LAVYVDDLFISSKNIDSIHRIELLMKARFKDITFHHGLQHEYLGAHLDFSQNGSVKMTMISKIRELLKEYSIEKKASTPAANHLMEHQELPLLPDSLQCQLRSGIAKLLYLSINTRPDIALPVNYLCTRIGKFDSDDQKKFLRVLYYLNETTELAITLKCSQPIPTVHVFADASYGIRSIDRRSQTGMCVQLGEATIVARSGKQKLVTKSSTEAELVACSDSLVYGITVRKLLNELGVANNGIIMHQDNMSTIALLNSSKPSSIRTKHIDIRYFFLRDRVQSENLRIIHTPTASMIADLLTKPLQGSQFKLLRNCLMSCD